MLRLKVILIVVLIASDSLCLNPKVRGRITNDHGMILNNVELINTFGEVIAKTNCKGKFKVIAKIGDTLTLKKIGYKEQTFIFSEKRKVEVNLSFDYKMIKQTINEKYPIIYGKGSGQPIYILDGIPTFGNNGEMKDEDVGEIKVIKGTLAVDLFGKHARNGVILITTNNCNSDN